MAASIIIGGDFNISLNDEFRVYILRGICYEFELIIIIKFNDELALNDLSFFNSTEVCTESIISWRVNIWSLMMPAYTMIFILHRSRADFDARLLFETLIFHRAISSISLKDIHQLQIARNSPIDIIMNSIRAYA